MCLARADDASLAGGLTQEAYLARPHAGFVLDLAFHASIERSYVEDHQLEQFDRLLAADFLVLPFVVAQSDCLALVPQNLAALACRMLPLQTLPCPFDVPDLDVVAIWNRRLNADPEIAWLRQIVAGRAVTREGGPATGRA